MVREEIFKSLFTDAVNRDGTLEEEDKSNLCRILDYDLTDGVIAMKTFTSFSYLFHLFDFLLSSDLNLTDDVDYSNLSEYKKETFISTRYKREFSYKETDLYVANADSFGDIIHDNVFYVIEAMAFAPERNMDLLELICNHNRDKYILLFNSTQFTGPSVEIYSYAFLKYLEQAKVSVDPDLQWNWNTDVMVVNVSHLNTVCYSQYFDVYDVVNEWHHSTDVLTAFLKMYQVLEYLGYRKKMVGIVAGSAIKSSFLMHIKTLNATFNERVTLKDLFVKDLDSLKNRFSQITPGVTAFIRKYWPNANGTPYLKPTDCGLQKDQINSKIANFVYDVRCAIVHNKESEFHITYTNVDEYRDILPLMKEILALMPSMVINCLNKPNSNISYPVNVLKLY